MEVEVGDICKIRGSNKFYLCIAGGKTNKGRLFSCWKTYSNREAKKPSFIWFNKSFLENCTTELIENFQAVPFIERFEKVFSEKFSEDNPDFLEKRNVKLLEDSIKKFRERYLGE